MELILGNCRLVKINWRVLTRKQRDNDALATGKEKMYRAEAICLGYVAPLVEHRIGVRTRLGTLAQNVLDRLDAYHG